MTAYLDAIAHYFDASGRSSRPQYWFYMLAVTIMYVIVATIDITLDHEPVWRTPGILSAIFLALHILPTLTLQVRRIHDVGYSSWRILFGLIPLVGAFILLGFSLQRSTPGPNQFGPDPHDIGYNAGIKNVSSASRSEPTFAAQRAPLEELEKLAALRSSGALSEEEFQEMKTRLLRHVGSSI